MASLRIDDDIYERLKAFADEEHRSITNAAESRLKQEVLL